MGSVAEDWKSIGSTTASFSVAIIGGGLSGLSLAIGLLKYRHIDVQIYEAAPWFDEIGLGLSVGPNAQRALQLISPEAYEVYKKHATLNSWESHSELWAQNVVGNGKHEGKIITAQRCSGGQQSVHHARFLKSLVKLIPNECVHFGKRLLKIEDKSSDGGRVTLHFADGTTIDTDAILGADGIQSTVRLHLLGDRHPAAHPVYTGVTAYRSVVKMDKAVERLGAEHAQNSIRLLGPGACVISYPIEHGKFLQIVAVDFVGEKLRHEKSIVRQGLRLWLQRWGASAQSMIELLDSPDLSAWAMREHPPAPFYNKGCVVMMGDAAHAMTPFEGQGCSQAVEDALVLRTLLGRTENAAQIPSALAAFDQVRRPRSQRTVLTSRECGQLLGMTQKGVGSDLAKIKENLETRMNWIWDCDLVAQNEAALKLFQESLGAEAKKTSMVNGYMRDDIWEVEF